MNRPRGDCGFGTEASVVFSLALSSLQRAAAEGKRVGMDDRQTNWDALPGVVFAAVSVEAFMNEAAALASITAAALHPRLPVPPSIGLFADIYDELKLERRPLVVRLAVASRILTGGAILPGQYPYNDLGLLVQTRNAVMHYSPKQDVVLHDEDGFRIKRKDVYYALLGKGLVMPLGDDVYVRALQAVSTVAAARWACTVSADTIQDFISRLPQEAYRQILEGAFSTIRPPA